VADLLEVGDRLAADALSGRVGRDELGMVGLDGAQLVEERVVLVVADLGIVEDVVAVAVVVELAAQLRGALSRARAGAQGSVTSSAAGVTSRARS
jgi:hypothetical protein